MEPERKKEINGHKVEEYYWNRRMVVYVDNHLTEDSFEDVCRRLEEYTK